VQDEDNKRRLEELVIQGQKLSKSCLAIQSLNEGTSNATLGSLNTPLNALLEALESSSRILEKEEENVSLEASRAAARGRPATGESLTNGSSATSGTEERGFKFHFCNNQEVQRQIESIDLAQYNSSSPPVVLVGTPDAIEEEARPKMARRQSLTNSRKVMEVATGRAPWSVVSHAAWKVSESTQTLGVAHPDRKALLQEHVNVNSLDPKRE